VVLSYDRDAHLLTVEVVHQVADPSSHFVNRIEVLLNDKMIIEKEPPRQDTTGVSEVYPLTDVKSGDSVKVTAFCSRWGEKSEQNILRSIRTLRKGAGRFGIAKFVE